MFFRKTHRLLERLIEELKHMADNTSDLTAAVNDLSAAVGDTVTQIHAETQRILDAVSNSPSVDPAVLDATNKIRALTTGLRSTVSDAQAQLDPPANDTASGTGDAPAAA